MATLNIKNLPGELYEKLKQRAKRERRSVVLEVIGILAAALQAKAPLSVMELQGLGAELWREIEAGAHVEAERASWD